MVNSLRNRVVAAACLVTFRSSRRRRTRQYILNKETGFFVVEYDNLRANKLEFFSMVRMFPDLFDILLSLVHSSLLKFCLRRAVEPNEMLFITLYYFAHASSVSSLSTKFKWNKDTITTTIFRTAETIWVRLGETYIPTPTSEQFLHIAQAFLEKSDMPNCVGAVDGKHVRIRKPMKSGSLFYNYKCFFSIVLMAVADANRFFTMIDVGAYGSQSDGGVLKNSEMGRLLYEGKLKLPPPALLPGSNIRFPHFFIGDPAFQLSTNMMRAYSGQDLSESKLHANYRLSRARMSVECAFGILTARWRVLLGSICFSVANVERIVLACCVLHNFVKTHMDDDPFDTTIAPNALTDAKARLRGWRGYDNSNQQKARRLRDQLKVYLANNRID